MGATRSSRPFDLKVEFILSSPGTNGRLSGKRWLTRIHQGKPAPGSSTAGTRPWRSISRADLRWAGKMQAVLLHAGSGLLQGLMGVHGSLIAGVPMLIISGESLTYGEQPDFDPGRQWTDNLSIVGGPQRLIEPLVKFACQTASPYTIYQSIIRAGEMAQRAPVGPT